MWEEENPKESKAGMVEWVAPVLHELLHSSIHDPINREFFPEVGLDLKGIGEKIKAAMFTISDKIFVMLNCIKF